MRRKTYEVQAVRSGKWWALSAPAVRGVHSQVRRLEQAEPMIREALSMVLGAPADSFDVRITPMIQGELGELVSTAVQARAAADTARDDATAALRAAARAAADAGLPTRDAAELLGVSHQYASKLLTA